MRINNDQVSSLVGMAVGAAVSLHAPSYGLGSFTSPGTGFMPLLIGMAMIVFASIGLFHASMQSRKGVSWIPVLKGKRWTRAAAALFLLFGYALLLKPLGFIVTTVILIAFLLRYLENQRWLVVFGVAVVSTLAAYAVFQLWLEAQLPTGFLWT